MEEEKKITAYKGFDQDLKCRDFQYEVGKAYYDGWNNCNMQHSQCRSESNDVIKCLINGMKFYYEDNKEATWGTDKWSMPVKHIIEVLEKQGEQKPIMNVPPREVILSVWELGNEWKELTGGSISTEYGTQLDYIQKHWEESEYYLKEKQDEQKPAWKPSDEQIDALNDAIDICSKQNNEIGD